MTQTTMQPLQSNQLDSKRVQRPLSRALLMSFPGAQLSLARQYESAPMAVEPRLGPE
jgi:hypothetical protein